jgi:hypothetical protein
MRTATKRIQAILVHAVNSPLLDVRFKHLASILLVRKHNPVREAEILCGAKTADINKYANNPSEGGAHAVRVQNLLRTVGKTTVCL